MSKNVKSKGASFSGKLLLSVSKQDFCARYSKKVFLDQPEKQRIATLSKIWELAHCETVKLKKKKHDNPGLATKSIKAEPAKGDKGYPVTDLAGDDLAQSKATA